MKFEFNSNTVMAVIMFVTLLGGGYTYIENQIKAVSDNVGMLSNYDDKSIVERVTALEAVNVQKELAVINQKLADIKPYDPTAVEAAVNEIKVQIAKIQTKLEGLHTHPETP